MTALQVALDSLLGACLRRGSRIGDYLLPPADQERVARSVGSHDVHPSVFELYEWHGGSDIDRLRADGRWDTLIPGFDFVSPEDARDEIDRYKGFRADPLNPPQALDDIWRLDFCPVFRLDGAADMLPVDGSGQVWLMVWGAPPELVFPSIEALIQASVGVVESGANSLF